MTLAQLIAQARRDAGMTQQQLADTMGASRSLIAQWESGAKRELQWETICRIANATNQSTEYFKEDNMKKLKMKETLTKSAYEDLTASERRFMLKVEQAKEYSGLSAYPSTCSKVIERIPSEMWTSYTAKQLGEIMKLVHDSFVAGQKSIDKNIDQ